MRKLKTNWSAENCSTIV